MALLLAKEAEKKKKKLPERHKKVAQEVVKQNEAIETVDKIQVWGHPEVGIGEFLNFSEIIEIEGVKYKLECKNNAVRTDRKKLIEYLKANGYRYVGEARDENKARNKTGAGLQPVFGF